ncbi:hypothetical protein HY967_00980 [Candidatus Jorgensenbacteria bacterium]|nr:hypothetical protein [Candidatus Jorgensenbacteria bacterium]
MKAVLVIIGIVVGITILGWVLGWFGNAADVAKKEYYPEAMLKKYEWFIDQSKAIQKMDQDIVNFRKRAEAVDQKYAAYGAQKTWAPDVRVQYNHEKTNATDDLIAMTSQRNGLVREYNAQSEKFTWAPFKTRDDLPPQTFSEYRE